MVGDLMFRVWERLERVHVIQGLLLMVQFSKSLFEAISMFYELLISKCLPSLARESDLRG